jgi:hypothetical protein
MVVIDRENGVHTHAVLTESPVVSSELFGPRQALEEAILSVPLPGSPPRLPRVGAPIGLAFVDGALRQNHVRRVSDSLALVEHGVVERTVRIDLSLSLLTDSQYDAGALYSSVRAAHRDPTHPGATGLVWVPIARLSRRAVSPVEVTSGHGDRVPRLTQDETSRLMAPAMYRLLRAILQSAPDASNETSRLYRFLHWEDESRWVVQRALVALTTERAHPHRARRRVRSTGTIDGIGAERRTLALEMLRENAELLGDYYRLLDVVLNDYVVVVGLSPDEDEHSLSYNSPLEAEFPARTLGGRISRFARQIRSAGSIYDVSYTAPLPPGVRVYHMEAETEPGLSIENLYLTTNRDESRVRRLADDLRHLSEQLTLLSSSARSDGFRKILELELQTALRDLSEIVRRRQWEGDHVRLPLTDDAAPTCQMLHGLVVRGEATPDGNGEPRSALHLHPRVTPDSLAAAADELEDFDLGIDLSAEDDPARNCAHAYWRRPTEVRRAATQATDMQCYLRIVDASAARPKNVGLFVCGVLVLKLFVASVILGNPLSWLDEGDASVTYEADAVASLLLLVPGFLYARLELPSSNTVAGRLRAWVRGLAYIVIGSSVVVATCLAVGVSAGWLRVVFGAALVVDCLCLIALRSRFRRNRAEYRRRIPYPLPGWCGAASDSDEEIAPDVVFTGVGTRGEAT